MSKTEKFTIANLNPSAYTFKIKNSERRMKMYIKLTQAETEGWNAVKQDFGVLGDELMGSQIITQVAPQDLILPK